MTNRELGVLIDKGKTMIKEDRDFYFLYTNEYCGCALAMAYVAFVGSPAEAMEEYLKERKVNSTEWFAKKLNISLRVANKVDQEHNCAMAPASQIARRLKEGVIYEA